MQTLISFIKKFGFFDLITFVAVIGMVVFVLTIILSYCRDRWVWNNGVCRKNGMMWTSCVMLDGRIRIRAGSVVKHIGRWVGSDEYCL